jgi:hypothetical protein
MMWADAHDARSEANAAPDAQPMDHAQMGAMPLNSFAGVVPPNAQALAEAHKAYDATLPAAPAGPAAYIHLTLKDMTVQIAPRVEYNTGRSAATAPLARSCTSARASSSR